MRRPRWSLITCCAAGIVVVASLSGCANSSIQLPWNQKKATSTANATQERVQPGTCNSRTETDADPVERAREEASRDVAASRKVAWATGVKVAAANGDVAVASDSSETTTEKSESPTALAAPGGAWKLPTKKTGGTESRTSSDGRKDASATKSRSTSSETPSDVASNAGGAGRGTAASIRSLNRSGPASRRSPDALHWPATLPEGEVPERGDRTVVDPRLERERLRLDKSETRKKVAERYGFDPPSTDGAVAIPGTYVTKKIKKYDEYERLEKEQLENQVAVVIPGERVTVYAGGESIASMEFPASAELPSELASVEPIRAINDGTTQLLLYWSESPEEKKTVRYKASVLKAIGPFVGTVFEETVATRSSPNSDLRKRGYLEFLRGRDHCFIRWTPANESGEPAPENARILRWNAWEGVYRLPKMPPTAPDQKS